MGNRWIYKLPLRLRSLFERSKVEQELDDELQFHLALKIEELVAKGMSQEEARVAAVREMDGLEQQKELCRDTRRVNLIEDLLQDLRYAVRTLKRTPVLVAVIVLSLALGIGANAAIFGVMNAVLLKMLPVREPEKLFLMEWSATEWPDKYFSTINGSDWTDPATGRHVTYSLTQEGYQRLKANNHVFSDVFAFSANDYHVNLGLSGRAESGLAQAVSGNYFQGLGVDAVRGRALVDSDDQASASPVAVVSYNFFRSKLGGDDRVLGTSITVNGAAVTLVGVAPPEFFGVEPGNVPDLWIPLSLYLQQQQQARELNLTSPTAWWLGVIGRLKPEVTPEQARAESAVLFRQSVNAIAPIEPNDITIPRFEMESLKMGLNNLRDQFSASLRLLMIMVGVVLVIACANVAGLLLTRATARQREIAIRVSVGAGRRRIIRQLLTESVLLAFLGGAAGLLVMRWTTSGLLALLSSGRTPIYLPVEIDWRVLTFTAGVSLICGLLFGLVPALVTTRVDVMPVLKQSGPTKGSTRPLFTSGRVLVGAQVALCVLLTSSAGLLLGTLRKLQHENLGFAKENLLTFTVAPGYNGYRDERLRNYYEELRGRIAGISGVRETSFSLNGPIGAGESASDGWAPGYGSPDARTRLYSHIVGPRYMQTIGIRLLAGRDNEDRDTVKSTRVIVINQTAARMLFHGENPLGHTVNFGNKERPEPAEVVGVVADAKYGAVRKDPPPTFYISYRQRRMTSSSMVFQVRTGQNPVALINSVKQEVLRMDPGVPAINIRTEEQVLEQHLFLERTFATLSSSFAALALLLACVGLYGTVSYTVTQRTNEIGIRMALGAEREQILLMMLRDTALMVGLGLMAGLAVATMTTRYLTAQLFGISPLEPSVLLLASAAVIAATTVAGFIPARRASKVDPMVALRYE